jgi:anti-sigma factor RsiW
MPTGVASVAMEAATAHRMFAAGGEFAAPYGASAKAELANWLSRELGHSAAPPDLSKAGFRLVGGRLVATVQGPAGMYLYEGPQGQRITLFMRPMERRDMNAPMRPMHRAETVGYVWARNGLGFGLVSSEPTQTLHELANEIRDEMSAQI